MLGSGKGVPDACTASPHRQDRVQRRHATPTRTTPYTGRELRARARHERGACTPTPGACEAVRTASCRQLRVCQSRRARVF
eukprot:700790-Prymnesium_polylepis.1